MRHTHATLDSLPAELLYTLLVECSGGEGRGCYRTHLERERARTWRYDEFAEHAPLLSLCDLRALSLTSSGMRQFIELYRLVDRFWTHAVSHEVETHPWRGSSYSFHVSRPQESDDRFASPPAAGERRPLCLTASRRRATTALPHRQPETLQRCSVHSSNPSSDAQSCV
jgi:hypothetical protein